MCAKKVGLLPTERIEHPHGNLLLHGSSRSAQQCGLTLPRKQYISAKGIRVYMMIYIAFLMSNIYNYIYRYIFVSPITLDQQRPRKHSLRYCRFGSLSCGVVLSFEAPCPNESAPAGGLNSPDINATRREEGGP